MKIKMDEDVAKKFEEIKTRLGLKHDIEVLRFLVNYYYSKEIEA
mgnify:CR=1 FL=1